MIRPIVLSLSFAGAILAACEDDSTSSPPTSSSSSSGSSSGGSSSGGNGEPEPYTPTPKLKSGALNVFLGTTSPSSTEIKLSLAGYFLDYTGAAPGTVPDGLSFGGVRASECTRRKSGTCELVKCKATKDPSFDFAQAKYATAGEVTVKRVANGTELKSTPNAQSSNAYLGEVADPTAGTPGELITVSAVGADVPAFSETIELANRVTVTTPGEITVAKGTDTKIEWTGGRGPVKAAGTGGSEGTHIVSVSCTFDGAAGSGTIPGVLLGDDVVGQKISLGIYSVQRTKTVGDYEIDFTAHISNEGLGGGNVQVEVK